MIQLLSTHESDSFKQSMISYIHVRVIVCVTKMIQFTRIRKITTLFKLSMINST